MASGTKRYHYFAGGERVSLSADGTYLAIDLGRLDRPLRQRLLNGPLREDHSLRDGLYMVERKLLSDELSEELEQGGALEPVLRQRGARIVVLPEVRVSVSDERQARRLRRFLKREADRTETVRSRGGRWVLRPKSGRGVDALALANRLHEEVGPALAQPRFLRIVPRPASGDRDPMR